MGSDGAVFVRTVQSQHQAADSVADVHDGSEHTTPNDTRQTLSEAAITHFIVDKTSNSPVFRSPIVNTSERPAPTTDADGTKPDECTGEPAAAAPEKQIGDLRFIKFGNTTIPVELGVKLDVQPAKYVSPGGEKISDIARRHLGPQATANDVDAYVRELVIANFDNFPGDEEFRTSKGQTINLLGHKPDGSVIYKDWRGMTLTIDAADNSATFRYPDSSGHTVTPGADDTYTKKYFGPKPEDNYTVVIGENDLVLKNDRVDPGHRDAGDLSVERSRLASAADQTIMLRKENVEFHADMKQFEDRAKQAGLSDKEVAQTFAEVSRILELKGNAPLTDRERVRLALGIMRGAAEPTSNDQGDYNTCQVTVVENRLYMTQPSAVARTLADIASRGQFVAADGTLVKMDAIDLRAHGQSALNAPRGTWVRTYASQVYQLAAINAYHTYTNESKVPPGEVRYRQYPNGEGDDNGERLYDYSAVPGKIIAHTPGDVGYPNGTARTLYLMSGKWAPETVLTGKNYAAMTPDHSNLTNIIAGPAELAAQLKRLHDEGKLPASVVVHVNSDPLLPKRKPERVPLVGKADAASYLSDVHVINIIGYDEKTGAVQLDNQWSNKGDFISTPLTVDQVWSAMNRPSWTTWMDRLEAKRPSMTQEQFGAQLAAIMKAAVYQWDHQQERWGVAHDRNDEATTRARFNKLVAELPPKIGAPIRKETSAMLAAWDKAMAERDKKQDQPAPQPQ